MSARNLARHFLQETGQPPHRFIARSAPGRAIAPIE
jgi:transcriptional regulator GlxA family with amidase domain